MLVVVYIIKVSRMMNMEDCFFNYGRADLILDILLQHFLRGRIGGVLW